MNKTLHDSDDEKPILQLRALGAVKPPALLVARVMQKVQEPAPFHLWNWLRTPRKVELRLSPLWAVGGVAVVAAMTLLTSSARPLTVAQPPAGSELSTESQVLVRFVIHVQGAREVAVAGDFNGWDPARAPLQAAAKPDIFAITLPLTKGETYTYKFLVDGKWIEDPTAEARPDGFGARNSILRL